MAFRELNLHLYKDAETNHAQQPAIELPEPSSTEAGNTGNLLRQASRASHLPESSFISLNRMRKAALETSGDTSLATDTTNATPASKTSPKASSKTQSGFPVHQGYAELYGAQLVLGLEKEQSLWYTLYINQSPVIKGWLLAMGIGFGLFAFHLG